MLRRIGLVRLLIIAALLIVAAAVGHFAYAWYGPGPLEGDLEFTVKPGVSMASLADELADDGAIPSALTFRQAAHLLGKRAPVKAGDYLIPAHCSEARILHILQGDEGVLRRRITIPEGLPSVLVQERLMAVQVLTGAVGVPAEGSVLPETYEYRKGESRQKVLERMQAAMDKALADLWAKRAPGLVVKTPAEAVTLASIVEKETGKADERPMVAALYSNRLRKGMPLQADPTIIYPLTSGKPLGRRILESEIHAHNAYNTYAMRGLPAGPITNPGWASLQAVLHPAQTNALYMVADGTGGHAFADTLEQHNANVARWYKLRRERGER